jgi:hypothetical protein
LPSRSTGLGLSIGQVWRRKYIANRC